jgi:hypothetical protein
MINVDVKNNAAWVVVATMTPWDELPRLRHQVARALTRHYNVFYINFPINWRKKLPERWSQPEPGIVVWEPSSRLYLPWRLTARHYRLRQFEASYFRQQIQRRLQDFEIKPVALVNFDYRQAWLMDHELFPKMIYICNDDFSLFAPMQGLAELVREQIHQSAAKSDFCLVTSESYLPILDVGQKAQVFVPGHDLPVLDAPQFRPYQFGDRIRVGFMGNIDKRLSASIIERVVREPDLEWHMIGRVADPHMLDWLGSFKNIELYSPLTGRPLLEWLLEMDVLAMPYDLPEKWANSVSTPNKTLSYFASGKPIVISSLPAFCDWGPYTLYHANTPEEFVLQVRRARSEDTVSRAQSRIDLAREYTWEKRITVILDLIENESAAVKV